MDKLTKELSYHKYLKFSREKKYVSAMQAIL